MAAKFSGEQPMREQILKLLKAVPFTPFVVDVAEDVQYSIGTNDHATAFKRVLAIEDDRGYVDLIPYAHIRRLHHRAPL